MCHCPSISWPNFFQGQKWPKSWFFDLFHDYLTSKILPRSSYDQVCHHPFDSIFDGLQSGIDHCTKFSWPNFSEGLKCPKTWFFTYSTTIQPTKPHLEPLTIMSISIYSILFFKGYNLVRTIVGRSLGWMFCRGIYDI